MNKNNKIILGVVIVVAIIVVGYLYYVNPTATDEPSTTATSTEATTTATTTTVTSTSTQPVVTSPTAITLSNNNETVVFNRGERFAVSLGDIEWTLSFSKPNIVNRVRNIMVMRGSQGVYTADNPGTTVLTAQGRPNCVAGQMCAQYIVEFKATIVVK